MAILAAWPLSSADVWANSSSPAAGQAADVKGTWSGTFYSRHSGVSPFTITAVIDADSHAHLIGKSSLSSDCFKDVDLKVTVDGSKVSLAGSDENGANITFQGMVDQTGTLLKLRYIINGSASGKCESDDGTGSLGKR